MSRAAATVVCLLATTVAGCAAVAKRPPTPAAELPIETSHTSAAPPGERYYVLVFGSQSAPKRAKYTHTWATVVRATGCDGPGEPTVEEATISWMPASLDIRTLARKPEEGANLALHFTIEEMLRNDERVSVWGPYEVCAGFYHRFLVQKQFLESGRIGYQCIDSFGEAARLGNACDCTHAITDMDPQFARARYPLAYFGTAASRHIARELHHRPIIIDPPQDNDWLLPKLGLDKYPITREAYRGRTVANTPENVEAYLRTIAPRR